MTFADFMKHVDAVISGVDPEGFGVYDYADAPWHDLYDETAGEASHEDICSTLAEYDDTFAAILALAGEEGQ